MNVGNVVDEDKMKNVKSEKNIFSQQNMNYAMYMEALMSNPAEQSSPHHILNR